MASAYPTGWHGYRIFPLSQNVPLASVAPARTCRGEQCLGEQTDHTAWCGLRCPHQHKAGDAGRTQPGPWYGVSPGKVWLRPLGSEFPEGAVHTPPSEPLPSPGTSHVFSKGSCYHYHLHFHDCWAQRQKRAPSPQGGARLGGLVGPTGPRLGSAPGLRASVQGSAPSLASRNSRKDLSWRARWLEGHRPRDVGQCCGHI